MGDAALLAMDGDGVVGEVADGVGLVVANREIAFLAEKIQHDVGETRIAIVEHADLPRA
jgi:hypothetical protein